MTAATFIDTYIRGDIGDTDGPGYRWLDTVILNRINAGMREIGTKHPESLCGSTLVTALPSDLVATSGTIYLTEAWHEALRCYVDASLLGEDQLNEPALAKASDYAARFQAHMAAA